MEITVDSRRCGAGKTTGANGIYEILRENYSNNQPTLLVLPSIGLADDYQKEGLSKIKKINSDNKIEKTIELDLLTALINNEPIIAITKQAFINIEINDGLKRKYSLIIDEAFDTWDFISYEQDKDDKMFIDWKHLCHVSQALLDNDYVKINLDDLLTNSFTKSHYDLRRLSRKTFDTYMLTEQQKSIQKGKQFNVVFIQELKKEVLDGWEALHIAASCFEMTFMSLWMMKNDLNYSVLPGCEFEKHETPITIHYPDDGTGGILWSKNKRNNNESFLDEVHTYVKNNVKEPALTLLNNSQEDYIPNGIKAKHNEAGSNNFMQCKSAILESTLNPDTYQLKWLTSQVKDVLTLKDGITADEWVFNARTGYTYYQILMRTQLRVNKPVDIFLIDKRAVVYIPLLFSNVDLKDYVFVNKLQKSDIPIGRPASGSLEPRLRAKAKRLKKKYPEKYEGMSARQILDCKSVT